MPRKHRQEGVPIEELPEFPPTVVDHEEYQSGYDLLLLDNGTQEEPRFIRTYNDGRQGEFHL